MLGDLRSAIAGAAWPVVPAAPGGSILAMLFQLERSQWLPPLALWQLQRRQLAELLRHSVQACPYYADRIGTAIRTLRKEFPIEEFASLPLLTRRDVQVHYDDLISRTIPHAHGKVHRSGTSGSTGEPVRYASTDLASFYWQAFNLRDHLWHQRDLSRKLATLRFAAGVETIPNWFGVVGESTLQTGPCVTIPMGWSIEAQARRVVEEDPAYLTGYPNNIVAVLQTISEMGRRLPGLLQVRTIGEAVTEEARRYVAQEWRVPLIDLYTSRESGYIALQCPDGDHYHVQSEGMIVEILDERHEPCMPGDVGQVVVTPLHNFAFPLIRYVLGDYAEVGEAGQCKRGLPVLRRIMGRSRNLMKLPDGSTRWPVFGTPEFRAYAPIRQFQFVQSGIDELEVRLVVERALTNNEQTRLGEYLVKEIGYPLRLRWCYMNQIPASPSGKFEDFIRTFD